MEMQYMDYNENGDISIPPSKEMTAIINEKPYIISTLFSLNQCDILLSCFNESEDHKKAVALVILDSISDGNNESNALSLVDILQADDTIFTEFINAIIEDNHEYIGYIGELDDELPLTYRFCRATVSFFDNHLEQLGRMISEGIGNLDIDLERTLAICSNALAQIGKVIMKIDFSAVARNLYNSLQDFGTVFSKIVSNIKVPTISEEEKNDMLSSCNIWGEYGWTVIPHAPIELFFMTPINLIEADKIGITHCKKADMDALFTDLRKSTTRKKDFDEAVFCFKNRCYKSCALILFGIIDSKFIKLQPKSKLSGERRKVGLSAIVQQKKNLNTDEKKFFHVLRCANLFRCLISIFQDTNDFTATENIVNRNFIDHGMNKRQVCKKDCIKLFLALYNLLYLLDDAHV